MHIILSRYNRDAHTRDLVDNRKLNKYLVTLYRIFDKYEKGNNVTTIISHVDDEIILLVKPRLLNKALRICGLRKFEQNALSKWKFKRGLFHLREVYSRYVVPQKNLNDFYVCVDNLVESGL